MAQTFILFLSSALALFLASYNGPSFGRPFADHLCQVVFFAKATRESVWSSYHLLLLAELLCSGRDSQAVEQIFSETYAISLSISSEELYEWPMRGATIAVDSDADRCCCEPLTNLFSFESTAPEDRPCNVGTVAQL